MDQIKSHRIKIGGILKYPVNITQVSKELVGVSMFAKMEVWFTNRHAIGLGHFAPGYSLKRINGNISDYYDYTIRLEASFNQPTTDWTVNILAIDRNESKQIQEFMLQYGLPAVKQWLLQPRSETWFMGRRTLQIGQKKLSSEWATLEFLNEKIVAKQQLNNEHNTGYTPMPANHQARSA